MLSNSSLWWPCDVLLQSDKGTQRLTLKQEGKQWRAGEEIEQIGIIQQEVVDLPGTVIKEVRRKNAPCLTN